MESSKKITSIMMVVAVVTLAALAFSVYRDSALRNTPAEVIQMQSPLPGLAENLLSLERVINYPATSIRSIIVERTNGEQTTLIRDAPDNFEFKFLDTAPENMTPFSAILFTNAVLLDSLESGDAFTVSGTAEEKRLGSLTYTSFDGLVLESLVFRSNNATWLRMVAAHSPKLAARFTDTVPAGSQSAAEVARRLNGRVYRQPDSAN